MMILRKNEDSKLSNISMINIFQWILWFLNSPFYLKTIKFYTNNKPKMQVLKKLCQLETQYIEALIIIIR